MVAFYTQSNQKICSPYNPGPVGIWIFWNFLPIPNLSINPFPNDKFQTLSNWQSLQTTILSLMKMMQSSPKW